jgi:hypothetical protein
MVALLVRRCDPASIALARRAPPLWFAEYPDSARRPAHDLRRLGWLLVHVFDATLVEPVVRALAPEGHP